MRFKRAGMVLGLVLVVFLGFFAKLKTPAPQPLIYIYDGGASGTDAMSHLNLEDLTLLQTISAVQDTLSGRDGIGLLLVLKDDDAKRFAEITRSHVGKLLILVNGPEMNAVSAWRITGAIEDGRLGFKAPEDAKMARYLRKRLKLDV